jgi:hypothetical protein
MEADVAAETRALVKELLAHDVPLRDIGTMLGFAFQRVASSQPPSSTTKD